MMVVPDSKRNSLLLSLKYSNGSFSSTTSTSTTNSVSSRCLSIKRKYSTRLALVKHKCATIKLKLKRNSSYIKHRDRDIKDYDSDEVTIVARYSDDKFQTTHNIPGCPTEKLSLDELADSTLNAVCYQVTGNKKPFYFECTTEVEDLECSHIITSELPLPLPPPTADNSLVESWEKYCQDYEPPEQTAIQLSPSAPRSPPRTPPPKYQPRNIPSSIKYKSQLNEYLKESSQPYSSLSRYYLNLHNSFANYHFLGHQDGTYKCSNYEMLQPILEENNKSTRVYKKYLYYILIFYISFAFLRSLI